MMCAGYLQAWWAAGVSWNSVVVVTGASFEYASSENMAMLGSESDILLKRKWKGVVAGIEGRIGSCNMFLALRDLNRWLAV